jgi:hypothetical protein
MLSESERKVLEFIVFHTYNTRDENGNEAKLPHHIIQASFMNPDLNDILNNLIEKKYITGFIWSNIGVIGTRCTEKGAKISLAIKHIPENKRRILVIDSNSVIIREES